MPPKPKPGPIPPEALDDLAHPEHPCNRPAPLPNDPEDPGRDRITVQALADAALVQAPPGSDPFETDLSDDPGELPWELPPDPGPPRAGPGPGSEA